MKINENETSYKSSSPLHEYSIPLVFKKFQNIKHILNKQTQWTIVI